MEPVKCPFCNPVDEEFVARNELCFWPPGSLPGQRGHLLVIPFRHTLDFFPVTPEERVALISLIDTCKDVIEAEFSPAGYNIGFNVGVAAGQTVMDCHCHVIPRYVGDVPDARWGIRGVVPGKHTE